MCSCVCVTDAGCPGGGTRLVMCDIYTLLHPSNLNSVKNAQECSRMSHGQGLIFSRMTGAACGYNRGATAELIEQQLNWTRLGSSSTWRAARHWIAQQVTERNYLLLQP